MNIFQIIQEKDNKLPSHPFTLKFLNPELEKMYRDSYYLMNLRQVRAVFLLFTILYALFGIIDTLLTIEHLQTFLLIRFAVVIPLFIVILGLSFTKVFRKFRQIITFIAFIVAGLGINAMLILEPFNLTYYAGLFMIFFSGFFIIRLDYYLATIAGIVVFFTFIVGNLIVNGWLGIHFVSASTFYLVSLFIGIVGSFYIDYFTRWNFLLNQQVVKDNEDLVERVNAQVVELTEAQRATILALAKLAESRDNETGEHVGRVGAYCQVVAEGLDRTMDKQMGMSRHRFIEIISSASFLHDIGKVGIEDSVLNKPNSLTNEEFELIKTHTMIGYHTLEVVHHQNPDNQFIKMGLEIVRSHHEWWNGTGYPDGLTGSEIPLAGRIMAVVDVYDAIRSARPYKGPMPHEAAVKEIVNASGTHFDPMVVLAFLAKENRIEELSEEFHGKAFQLPWKL